MTNQLKVLALSASLLASGQALAVGDFLITTGGLVNATTIAPFETTTGGSLLSTLSSEDSQAEFNQELMVAAREDASHLIVTEGEYGTTELLEQAFTEVQSALDAAGVTQELSDLELASLVVQLGNSEL